MLGKTLAKIDRFYPILAVVLIALSVLVLISLKSVLSGLTTSSEFDPDIAEAKTKIDSENLTKAYKAVFEKEVLKLNLAQ